jgi:molybdopterin-guanine dinucleotide biosynthesis protein B
VQKLKITVIAVVGSRSSGKTTTIEVLTKELTKRGYKVAAIKHIPEPNFTIDTEEKDTWRFAQSGVKTIVSVASDEIATIEKMNTKSFSLEEILQRCKNVDLVFLEGFKKLVGKNYDILKIVTVKSAEEALEASKTFKPILAFTGLYSIETLNLNIPYINVLKNREKIADVVEKNVRK